MTTTSTTVTAPRGRHAAPKPVRAIGGRWWWIGGAAFLAVFAYVPLLAVRPGVVTPDTKTYLYLDPTRFLKQVAFMWDPTVGLGTVTHEYIGYLLPMGPFFAVFHLVGVPVWVAQRLWLGSILMAAGVGVLYLSSVLGLSGPGPRRPMMRDRYSMPMPAHMRMEPSQSRWATQTGTPSSWKMAKKGPIGSR